MIVSSYEQEFRKIIDRETAGLSLEQRAAKLRAWLVDAEREGMVPVGDEWVCGLSANGQYQPTGGHESVSSTLDAPQSPSRPKSLSWVLLSLLAVAGIALVFWMFQGTATVKRPLVPTKAVTASDYGPMAPVSLVVDSASFGVQAFDPKDGWPHPVGYGLNAFWGETTINQVFALDAQEMPKQLPATIKIRHADGSETVYRIHATEQVERDVVEYAAQNRVGVTIVAVGKDSDPLTIIKAVPADTPTDKALLDTMTVTLLGASWTIVEQQLQLGVELNIDVPRNATGDLILETGEGHVQTIATLPLKQPRIRVTTDPPKTGNVQWTLRYNSISTILVFDVPPAPVAEITWGNPVQQGDTLLVPVTIIPKGEGGALLLDRNDVKCGLTNQILVNAPLNGQSFPVRIDSATTVSVVCPVIPTIASPSITVMVHDHTALVEHP